MRIILPLNPTAASRPRVSRWSTYYGKAHTQFQKDAQELYTKGTLTAPKQPLKGIFKVDMTYHCKMPKMSLKKAELLDGKYCDKKIDLDNITKLVQDEIISRYIKDDCFIVELSCRKFWSRKPRIEIEIKEI